MQYFNVKCVRIAILLTFITLSRCSFIRQQPIYGDIVAAFADFNSDGLTDVLLIRNNMSTLVIKYGTYTDKGAYLRHDPYCNFDGLEITSAVPGHFDGDALMDVLITLKHKRNAKEYIKHIYINWGSPDGINCSTAENPFLITLRDFWPLDLNLDGITDVYGLDEYGERVYFIFHPQRKIPVKRTQLVPSGYEELIFSVPGLIAFQIAIIILQLIFSFVKPRPCAPALVT
ncbi:T-cell immunomodulatory protein-like [Zeugodacus cucurbitae]|uniref:T-cell immunomodulatory protein-like n=1 Tax=Zeugodacus cucurbitae TaxID=28588 RepID=UPI000596A913|nr:T-cell immunomodulatory protein-like [Zeugodacus cucurbitae]